MSDVDLLHLNETFETAPPEEIITWAWQQFHPRMAATSSFQTQSLPLLHIIAQTAPQMPVYFLDTGFHFPETLAFRDQLAADMGLNVCSLTRHMEPDLFWQKHGELHRTDPDQCCYINKVEPLHLAKRELDAWITGIRRDQTAQRRNTEIVTCERSGQYKVCPMATWSERDIWRYIHQHDLPVHPLLSKGYMSIGCAPCTRPVGQDGDTRSGRWQGQTKTECGLHVEPDSTQAE